MDALLDPSKDPMYELPANGDAFMATVEHRQIALQQLATLINLTTIDSAKDYLNENFKAHYQNGAVLLYALVAWHVKNHLKCRSQLLEYMSRTTSQAVDDLNGCNNTASFTNFLRKINLIFNLCDDGFCEPIGTDEKISQFLKS